MQITASRDIKESILDSNCHCDIVMSNIDDETARELKMLLEDSLIKQNRRNKHRGKKTFSWIIKIG